MHPEGHNSGVASLRSFVDRLVRLEEEKKELAAGIKDVKAEARGVGFDVKVVVQMVKETMMDNERRAAQHEYEEICELYRAQLGMLRGTPLGDAARKRAAAKPPRNDDDDGTPGDVAAEPENAEPELPEEDVEAARERGREAGRSGAKIFANPYVSGDPRRAAWDEGWCEVTGSDGMEVPDTWRRKRKPKPGADGEDRSDGDGGEQ